MQIRNNTFAYYECNNVNRRRSHELQRRYSPRRIQNENVR